MKSINHYEKSSYQMSPQEKAIQLTKSFGYRAGTHINDLVFDIAKHSALLCCDEVLNELKDWSSSTIPYEYWKLVKEEIQQLK